MSAVRGQARIVYVSDLERKLSGGGSYAVNWHAFDQLQRRFDATYAGPLTPQPPMLESGASKIRRRILRVPGSFSYFSSATLDRNAKMVAPYLADTDAVMFRSATRWCRCRPKVPYFVYLDVVFHTFFRNTFEDRDFDSRDLERIWHEEAEFLEGAAGVFFESRWGLDNARSAYGLKGTHYSAPGRGGVIQPPARDTWDSQSRALVSVAMNFRQKGGDITLAAFKSLKQRFPALTWNIVGGSPDDDWQSTEGISYESILRPDVPAERQRLESLLAKAFLIVHPTREDTSPLVLTEAAYFGCPAVSVDRFGIPELVENGRTGILLKPPVEPEVLADAIGSLLDGGDRYLSMRREARSTSIATHSWDSIGSAISSHIEQRLGL